MVFIFFICAYSLHNLTSLDTRINFINKGTDKLWGAAMSLAWANWAKTT